MGMYDYEDSGFGPTWQERREAEAREAKARDERKQREAKEESRRRVVLAVAWILTLTWAAWQLLEITG